MCLLPRVGSIMSARCDDTIESSFAATVLTGRYNSRLYVVAR